MQGSLLSLNSAVASATPTNAVQFSAKKPDIIQCDTGMPYSNIVQGLLTPRKHQVRWENAILSTLLGAKTYSRDEAQDILTRSIPHDRGVTSRIRNFDRLFRGVRYNQEAPIAPEPDSETPKLIKKLKELGKKAADKVIRTDKVVPLPEPTKADYRENRFLVEALQHGYANTQDGADRVLLMANLMRQKPEGKLTSVNDWLEAVVKEDISNFVGTLKNLNNDARALYSSQLTEQFLALFNDRYNTELEEVAKKTLTLLNTTHDQSRKNLEADLGKTTSILNDLYFDTIIDDYLNKIGANKNLIQQTKHVLTRIHPTDPVVIKKKKSKIPHDFYKGARFYWDKDLA